MDVLVSHVDGERTGIAIQPRSTGKPFSNRRPDDIDGWDCQDAEFGRYHSHPHIAAPVAV